MRSVIDRNVVMPRIPVLYTVKSLRNLLISCFYFVCFWSNHCQACKCSLPVIVTLNNPKDMCMPCLTLNVICAALSVTSFKLQTSAPQIQHLAVVIHCQYVSRTGRGTRNRNLELGGKILLKLIVQSRTHLPLASAQRCIPVTGVITLLQGG